MKQFIRRNETMAQLNTDRSTEIAVKKEFRFLYSFYRRRNLKAGPFRIDVRRFNTSSENNKSKCSLNSKKESNLVNWRSNREEKMPVECPKCHTQNPEESRYCNTCATSLTPTDNASSLPKQHADTGTGDLTRGTVFASRYAFCLGRWCDIRPWRRLVSQWSFL